MKLLLASVYHTGTRFCRESLFSGFNFGSQAAGSDAEATNIHIEPIHIKSLKHWLDTADHVVVPLRNPLLVAASWKIRGMELEALDKQWQTLVDVVVPYGPIYLPIDHPARCLYLKELNRRMGLDLKTDWRPIGTMLTHEKINEEPLTDTERQQAESWLRLPLFDLYGDL